MLNFVLWAGIHFCPRLAPYSLSNSTCTVFERTTASAIRDCKTVKALALHMVIAVQSLAPQMVPQAQPGVISEQRARSIV